VRELERALLHLLPILVGALDAGTHSGEAGCDRGVVGEVGGRQLDDALVLHARHGRRFGEPGAERLTAGVGELIVGARSCAAGLGTRPQETERGDRRGSA
jgi:hypothetical protein